MKIPTIFFLLRDRNALNFGRIETVFVWKHRLFPEGIELLWLAMRYDTRPEQERCDSIIGMYQVVSTSERTGGVVLLLDMLHRRRVN